MAATPPVCDALWQQLPGAAVSNLAPPCRVVACGFWAAVSSRCAFRLATRRRAISPTETNRPSRSS